MNVFAKFDEIPSMVLQDIKETKRHGHTFGRSFVRIQYTLPQTQFAEGIIIDFNGMDIRIYLPEKVIFKEAAKPR